MGSMQVKAIQDEVRGTLSQMYEELREGAAPRGLRRAIDALEDLEAFIDFIIEDDEAFEARSLPLRCVGCGVVKVEHKAGVRKHSCEWTRAADDHDAYRAIQAELGEDTDFSAIESDLIPEAVEQAKRHAQRANAAWPPVPNVGVPPTLIP